MISVTTYILWMAEIEPKEDGTVPEKELVSKLRFTNAGNCAGARSSSVPLNALFEKSLQ